MQDIIALHSPAMGSGKSEVARQLIKAGYQPLKFAGPLKAMVRTLFQSMDMDKKEIERRIEGDLKEEVIPRLGVTTRHIMQTLGTEWGRRMINENIWIDILTDKVARLEDEGRDVVIDDLRFPNEASALRTTFPEVFLVKLTRPGAEDATGHVSEGALKGHRFDYELVNDGTLKDLSEKVQELIDSAEE